MDIRRRTLGEKQMKNLKLKFIAYAEIDKENIVPVVIDKDIDGNPFSLKHFVIKTDVKSKASYNTVKFNDVSWQHDAEITQGDPRGASIYDIYDGMMICSGSIGKCYIDGEIAGGAENFTCPKEVHKIRIPGNGVEILSGTFVKVWEIIEE